MVLPGMVVLPLKKERPVRPIERLGRSPHIFSIGILRSFTISVKPSFRPSYTAATLIQASSNRVGLSDGTHFVGRLAEFTPDWSHPLLERFAGVLGWKQATEIHTHKTRKHGGFPLPQPTFVILRPCSGSGFIHIGGINDETS